MTHTLRQAQGRDKPPIRSFVDSFIRLFSDEGAGQVENSASMAGVRRPVWVFWRLGW